MSPVFRILSLSVLSCMLPVALHGQSSRPSQKEAILTAIENELDLFPESTMKDLYKFFFQDAFGPGHLLESTPEARIEASGYLQSECRESMADPSQGPDFQTTGWQGTFTRVDLRVITDGRVPFETFFEAFWDSAKEFTLPDLEDWKAQWGLIEQVILSSHPHLEHLEQDAAEIHALLERGEYAAHHSKEYSKAYHPHYRIMLTRLFQERIRPLLASGPGPETE